MPSSPFLQICNDLNSPKVKSISKIHNTNFQIDVCAISWEILLFLIIQISNFPKFMATSWFIDSRQKGLFRRLNHNLIRQIQFEFESLAICRVFSAIPEFGSIFVCITYTKRELRTGEMIQVFLMECNITSSHAAGQALSN